MPRTADCEKRVAVACSELNSSSDEADELQLMQSLKFEEGFCQWLPPAAFFLRKQQLLNQHVSESAASHVQFGHAQPMSATNSGESHGTAFLMKNRRETPKPYKFAHLRDNSNYIKHYREEHNCRTVKLHRKDIEMYNLLANDMSAFYDRLRRNKNGGATIINGQIYFRQDEIAAVSNSNNSQSDANKNSGGLDEAENRTAAGGVAASVSHSIHKPSSSIPLQRTRSIPHYKPRGYYQMPFFNITGKVLKMMPREFEDERYED